MPLNILHHKSWHVWNKDNIAKVRKDEEEFAKKEAAKNEKNESSASRKRRREFSVDPKSTESSDSFNLFSREQEDHEKRQLEKAERVEKEAAMRKMGVAPLALGQSVHGKSAPWYTKSRANDSLYQVSASRSISSRRKNWMKELLDPLQQMKHMIAQTEDALDILEPQDYLNSSSTSSGKRRKRQKRHKSRGGERSQKQDRHRRRNRRND